MEKVVKAREFVGNTSDLCINSIAVVANARIPDDYAREEAVMTLNLLPGEWELETSCSRKVV